MCSTTALLLALLTSLEPTLLEPTPFEPTLFEPALLEVRRPFWVASCATALVISAGALDPAIRWTAGFALRDGRGTREVLALVLTAFVLGDGRGTREVLALVPADQLIIGHASFMQRGLLLLDLRFGAVALCLLLGDAGAPFGLLRLSLSVFRLGAVLPGGFITPAFELALLLSHPRALAHARHEHKQGNQDQDDDDYDHDDRGSGHSTPP